MRGRLLLKGKAAMGLLYAIFSIFITIFYPRQITNVICFGRHRDQLFIKSRKAYYVIYAFWTLFFGTLCLMMGSAAGVNNAFDKILYYCELNFGEYDYVYADSIYEEHDYIYQGDFTLVYYIRRNEDNLNDLIERIVKENNSLYKYYELSEMEVVYGNNGNYYIFEEGEVFAKVTVENTGLLKKIDYQWSREKLEQNLIE